VQTDIVPAEDRADPLPARAGGICACSRQFDGLTFQNQLRCAAQAPWGESRRRLDTDPEPGATDQCSSHC